MTPAASWPIGAGSLSGALPAHRSISEVHRPHCSMRHWGRRCRACPQAAGELCQRVRADGADLLTETLAAGDDVVRRRTLPAMASWGTTAEPFFVEVAGQPAALRRAIDALSAQRDVLAELGKHADRLPVFTGMGASYHACYPAVNALASRGKAALHVDAAELLHFRLPLLDGHTLLLAVSQSGRSAEVVRLAEAARAEASRPLVVAITNGLDNPLARLADLAL